MVAGIQGIGCVYRALYVPYRIDVRRCVFPLNRVVVHVFTYEEFVQFPRSCLFSGIGLPRSCGPPFTYGRHAYGADTVLIVQVQLSNVYITNLSPATSILYLRVWKGRATVACD